MADDAGLAVAGAIIAATGIILVIVKPEILTNLFAGRRGGVGAGPGTEEPIPSAAPAPKPLEGKQQQVFAPSGEWEDLPDVRPLEESDPRGLYYGSYNLPTPEQGQRAKQRRNDPRLGIKITPGTTIYQGTYFKIISGGFMPFEHVNFYFSSRELTATGKYKFNTITTGGEIQHQVDKADRSGKAEVKMLAPDTINGPVDVVAIGVESGRQINTTMYVLATTKPRPIKRFRMNVDGEKFYVIATDPHVVRGLIDMEQGQQTLAHIHGKVGFGPGKGGFNRPWNWHIIPTSITLSEMTASTCNVRPSTIQRDPAEYIRRNGFFCPMSARVEAIEYV